MSTTHGPAPSDIGQCVACGLCLPHCPTFRVTGKETASPRGRIAAMRAVVEDGAPIDSAFITMMDECLACRACEAACPSGVPFGRMIEAARAMAEPHRTGPGRLGRRVGLGFVLRRRLMIRTMAVGLGLAQAVRLDRLLPKRLTSGTPRVSLRDLRSPIPAELGTGPTAALLTGCVMNVAFRPVHRASMRMIAGAGYRATTPAPGGCCGALAAHYGQPDAARAMAKERIAEFEHADVVVVNSAGCSAHMKAYGELLADDPAWAERAERFSHVVKDLLEVEFTPQRRNLGRVTVHDACHHLHAQRIGPELRTLLSAGGADCVEVADAGRCCGAAGLYSVTEPEMSAVLRRQKAEAIHDAGAPLVAVANPGCAGQIAAGLREIGSPVRVVHPAELLAP
jgi:glycolate oxidase iron-sulfur subunit